MTTFIPIPKLHCKRCEHNWYPAKPRKPNVCPKCKSELWDTDKSVARPRLPKPSGGSRGG